MKLLWLCWLEVDKQWTWEKLVQKLLKQNAIWLKQPGARVVCELGNKQFYYNVELLSSWPSQVGCSLALIKEGFSTKKYSIQHTGSCFPPGILLCSSYLHAGRPTLTTA